MEKSLNSTTNSVISFDKINFNSFSSSPGWVGYFYARDLTMQSVIQMSSKMIESFFKDSINDFFLLTALAYDDSASIPEFSDLEVSYYESVYNKAKEMGVLIPYNGPIEDFYEDNKYPFPANIMSLSFDKKDILSFCELSMAYKYNKVVGDHCFLINPTLKIALYPHEDIGYGCISLSDDCNKAIEFLNFCSKDDKFEVVFSENINQLATSKNMLKEC